MSQGIFSRVDAYLAYALREIDTYPAPQSRLDKSLIELAETVRLGGASPDVIRQAVNDYLAANPPAGMTDEQIADSVNDSIANGDIQVGTVLTTDQINNINDVPMLAEEIRGNQITGAAIVNDELVISLGDGSSINAGDVVSDPYVPVVGTVVSVPSTEPAKVTIVNDADTNESTFNFEIPKGDDGLSPTITQVVDEANEYRLDITDQNGTYRTPNLKGIGDNIILGTDIVGEQSGVVFEVVGSRVGDMYFNTDNGNIYERDDANSVLNSWAFKGNVRGLQGKSNYELACEHGFVGTEQDYLDSLVGEGSEVKVVSTRPELSNDDVELKVWYYYQVDNSGEDSAWKYRLDLPNTADYPSGDYAVYFNMKPYCGTFSVSSPALTNRDTHKYYIIMDLLAVTSTVIEESIADGTKNILEVVQCTQEEPNGHTVISYPIVELGKWVQTIYIGATKDTASEVTLSTGTSVNGFVTFESLSELVGNRSNLQTVNKNNIVEAINELDTLLRYNNTAVLNTTAQDVVGAINELKASTNRNMFMLQNENVLTHALTYDPLTSNEFYAFDCSGLPNTMRYGYCRVNVSQDPLYRDVSFECPTSGRTYVNTIGADPDDPTVLGSWSGWHVSLLEEDMKEYTEDDILEMLNLSEVELDILSNLIDDDNISLNKTFSSSKIFQSLQEILEEGKRFTLSAIATKIGTSYKIVTSISQMVDTNYIYLLGTSTGYDMYIVDDGGRAVKIGDTQVDLSDYYDKTQADDKFVTKADADSKYATITTVDGKVDKSSIATSIDSTSTNDTVPTNKAVYDLFKIFNTKINGESVKTDILSYAENLTSKGFYPIQVGSVSETNIPSSTFSYTNGFIMRTGANKDNSRITIVLFPRTGTDPMGNKIAVNTKYNADNWTGWKYYGSTTAADVGVTALTWADNTNYEPHGTKCYYMVKNGVCYVTIDLAVNSPAPAGFVINDSGLPKPAFAYVHNTIMPYTSSNISLTPLTVAIIGTQLEIYNGSTGARYLQIFSYPVAE